MIELLSKIQKQEIIRLIEIKYIDGVTSLLNVDLNDSGDITGVFEDRISTGLAKQFLFKITNDEVGYKRIKNINYSLESELEELNNVDFRAIIHRVVKWNGLDIGLEYQPGDIRFKGTGYEKKLRCGYGHIRKHVGADQEALDCYLAPSFFNEGERSDKPAPRISDHLYKITQLSPEDGDYDEDKFMIGFASMDEAREAYLKEMTPSHFGGIEEVAISDLSAYKKIPKELDAERLEELINAGASRAFAGFAETMNSFKKQIIELTEKVQIEGRVLSLEEYGVIASVTDEDINSAVQNWKAIAPDEFANILNTEVPDDQG